MWTLVEWSAALPRDRQPAPSHRPKTPTQTGLCFLLPFLFLCLCFRAPSCSSARASAPFRRYATPARVGPRGPWSPALVRLARPAKLIVRDGVSPAATVEVMEAYIFTDGPLRLSSGQSRRTGARRRPTSASGALGAAGLRVCAGQVVLLDGPAPRRVGGRRLGPALPLGRATTSSFPTRRPAPSLRRATISHSRVRDGELRQ